MRMATYDLDLDVTRWGLHLLEVCTLTNNDRDMSQIEYVNEGYCENAYVENDEAVARALQESYCESAYVENDEAVARALQEEFTRIDSLEASVVSNVGEENMQASVLAQDWFGPSKRHYSTGNDSDKKDASSPGRNMEADDCSKMENDMLAEIGNFYSCFSPGEKSSYVEDFSNTLEITDEYGEVGTLTNTSEITYEYGEVGTLTNTSEITYEYGEVDTLTNTSEITDEYGEVGKRFNQMIHVPVPKRRGKHVVSSKKAQANWYRKLLEAQREAKPPPVTPEEAARLITETLNTDQKADVEGLLTFYGQLIAEVPTSLPTGVKYEFETLPVDAKAVADGDGMTVYVSTTDPRESSCVPNDVQMAAVQRSEAYAEKNYVEANALHKRITDSGYRVLQNFQNNEEILARKCRIRLRGIDAPENSMAYGEEAKKELTNIVQGKCLRVLVYGEDQYGRCVGDVYCNGEFVQELMLKKGLAWHYTAYDQRPELAKWEKEAQAKRVGLWASPNPEKPWEWRKDKRQVR